MASTEGRGGTDDGGGGGACAGVRLPGGGPYCGAGELLLTEAVACMPFTPAGAYRSLKGVFVRELVETTGEPDRGLYGSTDARLGGA